MANSRIRELNDLYRAALGVGGSLVETQGISALPPEEQLAIREKVEQYNDFNDGNDPSGEHAMGTFEHAGKRILWKIVYYDPSLERPSDDPEDPKKTARVLIIMLEEEN